MAYLDESLAPGESIVGRFPLHWTAKWRLIVYLLLAIPTLGIALLAALYEWIRLRSIETIDLRQTAWGRMLGFGDVVLTGRGESAMIFSRLAHPLEAKRAIESAYAANVEDTRAAAPRT